MRRKKKSELRRVKESKISQANVSKEAHLLQKNFLQKVIVLHSQDMYKCSTRLKLANSLITTSVLPNTSGSIAPSSTGLETVIAIRFSRSLRRNERQHLKNISIITIQLPIFT